MPFRIGLLVASITRCSIAMPEHGVATGQRLDDPMSIMSEPVKLPFAIAEIRLFCASPTIFMLLGRTQVWGMLIWAAGSKMVVGGGEVELLKLANGVPVQLITLPLALYSPRASITAPFG